MPRVVLALVLVVAALAAGCVQPAKRGPDRAAFDDGYAAFQAGQWQRSIDLFNKYLRSDPLTATRGEVYYYRGEAQIHLKRRNDALADFERAIGAKAAPPIDAFARVAIGNLYYEEGNDAGAAAAYAEALKLPPKELPIDQVLLRMGVSLQRLGKWAMADKYLQHLIDAYPTSPSVPEARRRLHADAFAVQTGAFAAQTTADIEAGRLRQAGFTPRIGQAQRSARTLYTVQVGKARTFCEAQELARRLGGAGFSTVIVP